MANVIECHVGAAKCAMLAQPAKGMDKMKQEHTGGASGSVDNNADLDSFDGPMDVTPNYLDIGYRGYFWRIITRVDQELRTRCHAQWSTEQPSDPFEKVLRKGMPVRKTRERNIARTQCWKRILL